MRGPLATPTRVSLCPPGPHCRRRVYCSFRSDVRDASAIRRVEGSALLSCALCAQGGGDNALYTQLATPRIPLFRELTCAEPCVILPFYRCLHCSLPVCCAARRRQSCLCKLPIEWHSFHSGKRESVVSGIDDSPRGWRRYVEPE